MKTTPGPFVLAEANTSIPIRSAVTGKTVATVRYGPTDYADACLLAAAPDMRDALIAMLEPVNPMLEFHEMTEVLQDRRALCRAALLKARG